MLGADIKMGCLSLVIRIIQGIQGEFQVFCKCPKRIYDLGTLPHFSNVCVNLQTDIRLNDTGWRFYYVKNG